MSSGVSLYVPPSVSQVKVTEQKGYQIELEAYCYLPPIVSAPDRDGRNYPLPIYDIWTYAFAVRGSRTSGTQAATFTIVPISRTTLTPQDSWDTRNGRHC